MYTLRNSSRVCRSSVYTRRDSGQNVWYFFHFECSVVQWLCFDVVVVKERRIVYA